MEGSGVRWLSADQQRDWRALIMATTLLFDRLDADLSRKHGLALAEYEILVRLSECEGRCMRMAQLADAVAHSRSRVTHTVKRLELAGHVTRDKTPEDGRGIVCTMTDRGQLLLENTAPTHVRAVREYLVDLVSPEDFKAMGRVMNAVADKLVTAEPEREMRELPREAAGPH